MRLTSFPQPGAVCVPVATGGVGESGASLLLEHKVGGPPAKQMVLRRVDSSLCPSTGAVGVLVVNGVPFAHGSLRGEHASIRCEAPTGSHVSAIVHTVPLHNGITCVRLGELNVQLDECDLV